MDSYIAINVQSTNGPQRSPAKDKHRPARINFNAGTTLKWYCLSTHTPSADFFSRLDK